MKDKIESSLDLIRTVSESYTRPAVACSFGKDSMVLLHLVRSAGHRWPVIFFREPFMPEKFQFANRVILEWGLTVHDYPPRFRTVISGEAGVDIANHYPFGSSEVVMPTRLYEPDNFSGKWLCGRDEVLGLPTGDFRLPWDCILVGHKNTDQDERYGKVPLHLDYRQKMGSPTMAFAIRNWTDSDIWEYTVENNLPIHHTRYEQKDGVWGEREDRQENPEWFPACTRCIDRTAGEYVFCPKLGAVINNVGPEIPQPTMPTYYGEKT